jgi:UDP-2,3-diacylglucosamine pyrophosphatase LpxH
VLYDALLVLNRWYNSLRSIMGRPYQSISAYLKHKVKNAVNYIGDFENVLVSEARLKNVDGMICGHIHQAAIKDIKGIRYNNAGDWVESCTALVEKENGNISIINWQQQLSAEELKNTDAYKENRYRDRCLAPTN